MMTTMQPERQKRGERGEDSGMEQVKGICCEGNDYDEAYIILQLGKVRNYNMDMEKILRTYAEEAIKTNRSILELCKEN